MPTEASTLTTRAQAARDEANRLDAEAVALNAQVDAESRALVERQRLPVEAAVSAAVRAALAAVDRPKEEPRPWAEVLADASVGIEGLFTAWCEMRASHASRASVVGAAGSILDSIDPTLDDAGRLVPCRRDTFDRMSDSLFLPVIEQAIEVRTKAAAGAAAQAVAQAAQDAGSAAAAKVK